MLHAGMGVVWLRQLLLWHLWSSCTFYWLACPWQLSAGEPSYLLTSILKSAYFRFYLDVVFGIKNLKWITFDKLHWLCLLSRLCHSGNREMSWRIKTWCEVYHEWCWQVFVQSLSSGRGCSTYTCCRTTGWMVWHKIEFMSLISHTVGSIVTMSSKHFLWLVI